jgi:hypothetical protein
MSQSNTSANTPASAETGVVRFILRKRLESSGDSGENPIIVMSDFIPERITGRGSTTDDPILVADHELPPITAYHVSSRIDDPTITKSRHRHPCRFPSPFTSATMVFHSPRMRSFLRSPSPAPDPIPPVVSPATASSIFLRKTKRKVYAHYSKALLVCRDFARWRHLTIQSTHRRLLDPRYDFLRVAMTRPHPRTVLSKLRHLRA